jgi:hypothetical protein
MYLDGQGDGFGVEHALFNILFNFYKLVCYLLVMEISTHKKKKIERGFCHCCIDDTGLCIPLMRSLVSSLLFFFGFGSFVDSDWRRN